MQIKDPEVAHTITKDKTKTANIVTLPGFQRHPESCIEVLCDDYEWLSWRQVDEIDHSKDALYIKGDLAYKIGCFLRLYTGGGHSFAPYKSDPDCHGAALFVTGFVDYLRRLLPSEDFGSIYWKHRASFTYTPQKPPVIIHLLNRKIDPEGIPQFHENNTVHSVVLLGNISGNDICFEKRGKKDARFSVLEAAEDCYDTRYRLYMKTCPDISKN